MKTLSKKQMQMIQHLPPSVVLNSKKPKVTGLKASGKPESAYVSPTASVSSSLNPKKQPSYGGAVSMSSPGVFLKKVGNSFNVPHERTVNPKIYRSSQAPNQV